MRKIRFNRLVASVKQAGAHVTTGFFSGRLTKIISPAKPQGRPTRRVHRAKSQ
jgi:hypothetical protein